MCCSYFAYVYSKWVWEKQRRWNRKLNETWKRCTELGWIEADQCDSPPWMLSLWWVKREDAEKGGKEIQTCILEWAMLIFPMIQVHLYPQVISKWNDNFHKFLICFWDKGKRNGILWEKCSVHTCSPRRAMVLTHTIHISINEIKLQPTYSVSEWDCWLVQRVEAILGISQQLLSQITCALIHNRRP